MSGTRSNFYKTPAFAYSKDVRLSSVLQNLRAYNAAVGNAADAVADEIPAEDDPSQSRRRKRRRGDEGIGQNAIIEEEAVWSSFSHEGYIETIRLE